MVVPLAAAYTIVSGRLTNTIHLSGRGWVLAVLAAFIVLAMVTGVELRRQRSNRKRPLRTATSASLERVAAEIMQLESKIDEFVRDLGPHHLATMALRDSRDEAREVMASVRADDVREAKPTPVRVESDDRGVDLLALQAIGAITLALPTVLPIGHVLTTWSLTLMPSLSAAVDLGLQRRGVPGTQRSGSVLASNMLSKLG